MARQEMSSQEERIPLLSNEEQANGAEPMQSSQHSLQTKQSQASLPRRPPLPSDSWGIPAGLALRSPNDEHLIIFRKALGINVFVPTKASDSSGDQQQQGLTIATIEEGRASRGSTGLYADLLAKELSLRIQHRAVQSLVYLCYFAQIALGATLTALGSHASQHPHAITVLGAINTALAGFLALIRAAGQPGRMGKHEAEYKRLLDWIEETDALLAVGIIGRNRVEIGALVERAFRKYNAVATRTSAEDNRADGEFYSAMAGHGEGETPVSARPEGGERGGGHGGAGEGDEVRVRHNY